jgi:H+/Cl- antiporter ClcA
VVGAISSFVAYALLWLINTVTNLAFHQRFTTVAATPEGHHLGWWVIAVPVAGALVIGFMARYGSEKIRGHGIPEALEAILLGRSRIQLKVALLKPLSAAISIGTGGPFGAEGPIIMTGGAFGSLFAQRFHLSAAERKTLLVAGAAAGMSAVFATPVAAVLLAGSSLRGRGGAAAGVVLAVVVIQSMRFWLFSFDVGPWAHALVVGVAVTLGLAASAVLDAAARPRGASPE